MIIIGVISTPSFSRSLTWIAKGERALASPRAGRLTSREVILAYCLHHSTMARS